MHAAFKGDRDTVSVLLNHKANKALRNKDGKTAANIALENGHKEIADLIAKGAGSEAR